MAGKGEIDFAKELGLNIARLRTDRGWSQERLANEAEIRQDTLSRLERGETEPKITTIASICGALHCGYYDILPTFPGMKSALIKPELSMLNLLLDDVSGDEQAQIITIAIAAAEYFRTQANK